MKTLMIFAHLIFACLAIGTLIVQDYKLLMLREEEIKKSDLISIENTAKIMSLALGLLWLSGLALVLNGYLSAPEQYILNEKLWAKIIVVMVLTLNGVVLHFYCFKVLKEGTVLLMLPTFKTTILIMTGVTSTVSWLFAVYLGIARPWNYTKSLSDIMIIYGLLWFIPFLLGNVFLTLDKIRLYIKMCKNPDEETTIRN